MGRSVRQPPSPAGTAASSNEDRDMLREALCRALAAYPDSIGAAFGESTLSGKVMCRTKKLLETVDAAADDLLSGDPAARTIGIWTPDDLLLALQACRTQVDSLTSVVMFADDFEPTVEPVPPARQHLIDEMAQSKAELHALRWLESILIRFSLRAEMQRNVPIEDALLPHIPASPPEKPLPFVVPNAGAIVS